MSKHDHEQCKHENLKHCKQCDVIECDDCDKEWGNSYGWTNPITVTPSWPDYPWTINDGSYYNDSTRHLCNHTKII